MALATLAACADDTGPPAPQASTFRSLPTILNGPAVDVEIDGRTVATNLPFGQLSPATALAPGPHDVLFRAPAQSSSYALPWTATSGVDYTAFVIDSSGGIDPVVVTDTAATPPPGRGALRIVHFAPHAPAIDVYRTEPGTSALTAVLTPFGYRVVSRYFQATPGTWSVVVSHAGLSDTALATGAIAIGDGQARTVVLLDSVGGRVTWRPVPDRN
ncbi:MAG TPA: DUF4397 domain-containing protein [Gemmatimonadales bacterium]|nr:DUF4397 domain-containing protein [Gemmatimonadales bacterium]